MDNKPTNEFDNKPNVDTNIDDDSSVLKTEEYYPEEEYGNDTPFQDSINTENRVERAPQNNQPKQPNINNINNINKKVNRLAKIGKKIPIAPVQAASRGAEKVSKAISKSGIAKPNGNGLVNFPGKNAAMRNMIGLGAAAGINKASQAENEENSQNEGKSPSPVKQAAAQAVNNAKEVAKAEVKKKAKQTIIKFIAKNPYVLLVLASVIVVLFIILAVVASSENSKNADMYGLGGYSYYETDVKCPTVTVYQVDDDGNRIRSAEVDFEREYIPGVINAEIGYFARESLDMAKLFAIAARSYAIAMLGDSCEIEGSARRQAFTFDDATRNAIIDNPDHPIMQAVNETYGLILTKNGELQTAYYDAACYQGEDESNYHIGYGSLTLGEGHIQYIPKSWAETHSGLMGYINNSKKERTNCYNNHGYGISQYGAYYLATEEHYNYLDLIEYYLGDVELKSIYHASTSIETSSGTNDIIASSLDEYLTRNGSSVEAFNEYILSEITKAGFGTRAGAVVAATALVAGFYQNYHARLPYTLCGQHYCSDMYNSDGENVNRLATSFYGVDPNWGTAIHNNSSGTYRYVGNGYDSIYTRYGPDCSGFVSWVLHNAGFQTQVLGADTFGNLGTRHQLLGSKVAEAGDLIHHEGHIMFVVGVDEDKEVYYIAHAAGGSEGVKINTLPFSSPNDYAVDMTTWYNNHNAHITIDDYRAGYVNGYTGESGNGFVKATLDKGVFFIGDSRTVAMCNYVSLCNNTNECNTSSCLAKVGAGRGWFTTNYQNNDFGGKGNVVINMGVNDLVGSVDSERLAEKYFNDFKYIADNNKERMIYIMSVNPVKEPASVDNNNVIKFNNKMQELIANSYIPNIKYLNVYHNVNIEIGGDGLHYNVDTYKRIYSYVMGVI